MDFLSNLASYLTLHFCTPGEYNIHYYQGNRSCYESSTVKGFQQIVKYPNGVLPLFIRIIILLHKLTIMQIAILSKHLPLTALFLFMLSCSEAQNVGIGTTTPKARLHVADSSVLFSGPSPLPAVAGLTPVIGAGTRMLWFPAKAAIRAGGVSGVEWNENNLGQYSTAFGRNTIASGQYSTSLGVGSNVTGNGGATALGSNNVVSGNYATAVGQSLIAQSYGSLVIGRYNTITGSTNTWVDTDPLFVIGNGFLTGGIGGGITRNDALRIQKNGNSSFNGNIYSSGNGTFEGGLRVDGTITINSKLVLDDVNISLNSSTLINPNQKPFIIIDNILGGNFNYPPLTFQDGQSIGQIIVIMEKPGGPLTYGNLPSGFTVVNNPNVNNTRVPQNRTIFDGGTITMIWDGETWNEIAVSN